MIYIHTRGNVYAKNAIRAEYIVISISYLMVYIELNVYIPFPMLYKEKPATERFILQ